MNLTEQRRDKTLAAVVAAAYTRENDAHYVLDRNRVETRFREWGHALTEPWYEIGKRRLEREL
jgi:hypothetical protein